MFMLDIVWIRKRIKAEHEERRKAHWNAEMLSQNSSSLTIFLQRLGTGQTAKGEQ
jgi:hypothetical protein